MITVTKLNGAAIVLNAELIETVEAHPDTLITLTCGNRIMVKEDLQKVVEKVKEYRKNINFDTFQRMANISEEN